MTALRSKIGQMLVMGFDGTELSEQSPIVQWLSTDGLGGVLLFDKHLDTGLYGKNLVSQEQIKQLIGQLNYYSKSQSLLIALDYEGGAVDRLTRIPGCMTTKPAVELASLSEQDFVDHVNQMALTLCSLGFNLNFAPVVDLNLNEQQGIIGALNRSFSADPERVAQLAIRFVTLFNQQGIICCYKHFPGHGSALGDTHQGFVDVTETFQQKELVPYQLLNNSNHGLSMVMTAHVINRHLDDSALPATLSEKILTGLLRDKIGYNGIVISDDLQMNAIANHYSMEETLRLTINAGADILIIGNQLGYHTATEIIDCIEQLVLTNKIAPSRIDEAYQRILCLKNKKLELTQNKEPLTVGS